MAYVPQALLDFRPPIPADGTGYALLWDNHDELYTTYTGAIAQHSEMPANFTTTTETNRWRFTSRGGADYGASSGLRLRLTVLAETTNTGGTLRLKGGASTVTQALTGGLTTYTLDATPTSADEQWLISLQCNVHSPAATIKVHAWSAEWLPTLDGTAFPSGYRRGDALWKTADYPVHTEGFGRLIRGPSAIARDRPVCIFNHFAPIGIDISAFVKYGLEEYWGRYDQTYQDTAGRGRIPRADTRPRRYRVDWYLHSSGSSTGQILIGGRAIDVPTANAWGTATLEFGQGDHEIRAAVLPGTTTGAYFEAIQVWRQA